MLLMNKINIPVKSLNNGFEVPVFGIGTWQMGGGHDEADALAIRTAIDLGVMHIDTAEIYANGRAEELVSQEIQGHDRSKLFIVSKVAGSRSPKEYQKACEEALKRLNTNYLDLYLIHWYDDNAPLQEKIKMMNELVRQGLIKNIGVSNFNVPHLKEAQGYSDYPIACNQVHYNLVFREPERKGLLEYCQENNVMLVAWRPVEKGKLTTATSPLMKEVTEKYQKSPAQIAINWLISQENVVTIAKSTNIDHLKENLGAIGWQMDPADIERLRADFPGQRDRSDSVTLD